MCGSVDILRLLQLVTKDRPVRPAIAVYTCKVVTAHVTVLQGGLIANTETSQGEFFLDLTFHVRVKFETKHVAYWQGTFPVGIIYIDKTVLSHVHYE